MIVRFITSLIFYASLYFFEYSMLKLRPLTEVCTESCIILSLFECCLYHGPICYLIELVIQDHLGDYLLLNHFCSYNHWLSLRKHRHFIWGVVLVLYLCRTNVVTTISCYFSKIARVTVLYPYQFPCPCPCLLDYHPLILIIFVCAAVGAIL